jgi:hypothetical protein
MSEPTPPTPRDFDAWALLASSDPVAFEDQRRDVIQNAIRRAPARRQRRLQQLQWQLDQIRACSPTPMAACLRMQRMLWQRIEGENGLLECLQQPAAVLRRRSRRGATSASVIPLRRPGEHGLPGTRG